MANLLINTTVGGNAVITTSNIGTYAITSIPTSFSSITVTSSFDTASADIYASMRVIRNNASSADGMYIGYGNSGSGITRIFGGGSTSGALEKYATYTVEPGSFRAPIFYDSADTTYYLDPNNNSYLSTLHVANATSGVSLHVGLGSTHGVYTGDNDRKYLVVSATYYPHMALVATSSNNSAHGAVFSFVGSESGTARQWNMGIANSNPFVFSIGYNRTGNNNPHYGIGDGWSGDDNHHARLSIDRDGNTKIRGMLYVNGTSGGISTGSAVIHAGNIGSQSVSYASTAGALSSMNISQFSNNSGYLTGITSGQVTSALGYTPYNSSNPSGYITGYTETDTLASVTGRGATTSTPITISTGSSQPLSLTTANSSPWHLALNRTDLGLTSRVFAHNSPYNGWYFEHNISIAGNTNWHSGNLTNLNQLSNGPGYITGYTETDTLNSVTGRGNTTSNSVRFGTHVDLSPTGSAFRFYDGTTFRGGFGTDAWGHSGSDANLVLYVNGDNTLFFSTAGTKRASLSSSAFNSLVALQQSGNQVLHAGNYTSYSPSLTGGGASGTWSINVTGSAGSASTAGSATNLSGTGGSSIQSTSTGTSYTANYQVRENAGGSGNTNEIYAPQLAFHWGGVVASSIMMESSGRMAIRNNPGGSYENFIAAVIYSSGYGDSTQWNTAYSWGNHASAGYQSASTAITTSNIGSQTVSNSNHLNSTRDTPSGKLQYWDAPGLGITEAPSADWHNTIRMGHGSPLSYYSNTLAIRMTGSGVGDIYTQTIMGGTAQGWKKHWNDGNDGVGSGLDADLLDGQQGSYYQAASSAITTSNIGSQSVSYATTAGALTSMNISQFTNNSGYITGYTETDTLATVTARGATTASGITFTAPGGSVLLKHAVSESDAWIFQENAANWGLYYKNAPSGNHTFGGYTTVGAETFGMSAANVSGNGVLTSNFVGATTAYAQWMLSNYTGYIWSASTIYAVGAMRAYEFRGNANVAGTGEASYHPAGVYSTGTNWLYGTMYVNGNSINDASYLGTIGTNTTPINITGASHKYLTINPGNGYEAMVRYIGGSGSSWYVGKRVTSQVVGTESFHFYSEAAGATVGGVDTSGNIFASGSFRAPIFYDSQNTDYYGDFASESRFNTFTTAGSVVIGGTFGNNAYNSVASTRLMFGGGNEPNNYSIGTNMENYGGNYTKLDIRWHTGIRMGAQPGYGGIRFFNTEALGSRIMSIGEGDANIRIDNNLWIGGAGGWITDLLNAKQNASTAINTGNIGSQSVSYASSAGTANAVAWTNVSSRPTALSQFSNDLGNYGGFLTSLPAHDHDRLFLTDSRGASRAPSYYDQRYAQWDFQNTSDTGAGGDAWHGLLTVAKWAAYDASHRQEQLAFTGDDLKRRTATSDSAWGSWKTILDSSNFSSWAAAASHTHSIANVSGLQTALDGKQASGSYLSTSGKAADSELFDGTDSIYFVRGNGVNTLGYRTTNHTGGNSAGGLSSGFYDGSGMSNMPTSDWYHLIVNSHYNSATNNQYEFQLATAFWNKSDFFVRSISPGDVGPWRTLIHNGNIGSQSVSYASTAGSATSAGSATTAQQLTKFGDIYGQDWNSYYVSGKLIVSNALGHSGANRPNLTYDYGVALSYGETGGPLLQMYFPENSGNIGTIFRKGTYRTGWNGNWSTWKTLVEQEGNLCTIVGGNGTGLEVHGNVGYNQDPLTYFLIRGQADTSWKALKIRLTGDAGGQDIEFRRIAENGTDARMWYVPRGANTVNFDYPIVQPSDSRLKDNITPISTPVDKIKSLRGVEFDWNSGEQVGTHDVGLIAQDVEAVLPEAVTTQEDGYKNLAYTKVIPLLVEAMKEQQAMIEALKAEIELLKNK